MKEKRVDIYLALAGFFQVLLIASLGSALTESFSEQTLSTTFYLASVCVIVFTIVVSHFYKKAFRIVKRKKQSP